MQSTSSRLVRHRGGSPWTGLGTVVAKETADHLSSARMRILEAAIKDHSPNAAHAWLDAAVRAALISETL